MEDDRAQVDLGIAADIEEAHATQPVQKQPKKRFVGRRTADASARNGGNASIEDSGAIQGNYRVSKLE
jgi:2-(3-amino-3-carboxypropyl)histidine synthase